jgi:hypothetical protein
MSESMCRAVVSLLQLGLFERGAYWRPTTLAGRIEEQMERTLSKRQAGNT